MNIRIIKNADTFRGSILHNKKIFQIEEFPSDYEGIKVVKNYLYDVEHNRRIEIAPEIKKYDIFHIKKLDYNSEFIYFTTIEDDNTQNKKVKLIKYNIETTDKEVIYSMEDDLSQYNDYKRTRVFIINAFYIFIQNEFIRYNLTEDYKDYFEFEQFLYSIKDDKLVSVVDDNLRTNGIDKIKVIEDNLCVIKTGFSLIKDKRYNILNKDEVSVEGISFINLGHFVSDILLMQKNIVLDTIDQAYFTETFAYVAVKGDFVVYSKVKNKIHEEEVVFYNYKTKDTKICINPNVFEEKNLANTYVIGRTPYLKLRNVKGTQFYNLSKNKVDIIFPVEDEVEAVIGELFIVSNKKKKVVRKDVDYIVVYQYPQLKLLHREKGAFKGVMATSNDNIYILVD